MHKQNVKARHTLSLSQAQARHISLYNTQTHFTSPILVSIKGFWQKQTLSFCAKTVKIISVCVFESERDWVKHKKREKYLSFAAVSWVCCKLWIPASDGLTIFHSAHPPPSCLSSLVRLPPSPRPHPFILSKAKQITEAWMIRQGISITMRKGVVSSIFYEAKIKFLERFYGYNLVEWRYKIPRHNSLVHDFA